jgi:hypothetical protein
MAFLAPAIAPAVSFIAKPLVKWGLVVLVVGGLALALFIEHEHRVNAQEAKRIALQERDDARDSANRWKNRSDQGDDAIAKRDAALNVQSAEVESMRVRVASLDAIARASAADADVARQAAAARAVELAAWVKSNPDKVCRLSPEMRARAEAPYQ